MLARAGDLSPPWLAIGATAGDHVDLRPHTELTGKVKARLHGKAGVGQQQALVVCFEVIEMRSIAMQGGRDVMPGAMGKELRQPRSADHVAGRIIRFPAGDGLRGRVGCLDLRDRGVAGIAHRVENVLFPRSGFAAGYGGPRHVVPDRIRLLAGRNGLVGELGPAVNQDEVARTYGPAACGVRLVMRIGRVRAR